MHRVLKALIVTLLPRFGPIHLHDFFTAANCGNNNRPFIAAATKSSSVKSPRQSSIAFTNCSPNQGKNADGIQTVLSPNPFSMLVAGDEDGMMEAKIAALASENEKLRIENEKLKESIQEK